MSETNFFCECAHLHIHKNKKQNDMNFEIKWMIFVQNTGTQQRDNATARQPNETWLEMMMRQNYGMQNLLFDKCARRQ